MCPQVETGEDGATPIEASKTIYTKEVDLWISGSSGVKIAKIAASGRKLAML